MTELPEPAERRQAVLRQALSVGVATGAYGISFGALAVGAGLNVLQACALSLLMFTGGSQFAFIGVLGAGGAGLTAVATATTMGVRNGFYGLAMAPVMGARGWRRPAAAQLTIDESTAVASAQAEPALSRMGFWATGLAVFALWNAATFAGALLGDQLGDPTRYGLDAAAAAAFLALLWPRLTELRPRLLAVCAALLAAALVPLAPAGVPVLATVVIAFLAWERPAPRDHAEPHTDPGPQPPA